MSNCTNKVYFLEPDRCQVNAHHMQVDSNHHHCAASTSPAQGIMSRAPVADGIVNDIEAAEQHAVAESTPVHFRAGDALDALIAILGVDNMRRTHACCLFHLEGVASHDANFGLWRQRPYHLDDQQTNRTGPNHQYALTCLWQTAQNGMNRDGGWL